MTSSPQSPCIGGALFDGVAADYHASAPQPPPAYCDLIIKECGLLPASRVIDLGCGSGALARGLAERGFYVTGVDCSRALLDIARRVDERNAVQWVQSYAEDYHPGAGELVDLMLAYEAFHLFSAKERVLANAVTYLRPGGNLAMGWCEYHWESVLRDAIIEVFASMGIDWGEWGYQECQEFPRLVDRRPEQFTECCTACVVVDQRTPLATTAQFLASIGKATTIDGNARQQLRDHLLGAFVQRVGDTELRGQSRYWLRVATRKAS